LPSEARLLLLTFRDRQENAPAELLLLVEPLLLVLVVNMSEVDAELTSLSVGDLGVHAAEPGVVGLGGKEGFAEALFVFVLLVFVGALLLVGGVGVMIVHLAAFGLFVALVLVLVFVIVARLLLLDVTVVG
jgi:hypothetical protein